MRVIPSVARNLRGARKIPRDARGDNAECSQRIGIRLLEHCYTFAMIGTKHDFLQAFADYSEYRVRTHIARLPKMKLTPFGGIGLPLIDATFPSSPTCSATVRSVG